MTKKIGPKEAALQAQREEALDVPAFLKRTETPEQAEKRRKKYAAKDQSGGLKVIEPVDPKIRKAIEKDLADDPIKSVTVETKPANMSVEKFLSKGLSAQATIDKLLDPTTDAGGDAAMARAARKPKAKKLSPVLAKAMAEKEKLNQLAQSASTEPMETTMKKATKKVAKTKAKKSNGAARERNGKYDWAAAETMAKAGKISPLPTFRSYGPHTKKFHELAKAKDTKGIKEFSAEFKDEKGARANLFRFRDLCLTALRK